MDPTSIGFRFGGGGETHVHPAIACAVILAGILILSLPRKHLMLPLLAGFFLIPMDQVLILGSFHFQMLRVIIFFGWVRILIIRLSSTDDPIKSGMNAIDKAVLWGTIIAAMDMALLWRNLDAIKNQLGAFYTIFGIYFLMRFLIRNEEDVIRTLRVLAYIEVIVAVLMTIEQATGQNPYVVFGGARQQFRENLIERGDRFRALAAFGHPILAGTFGGISLPLFIGLWCKSTEKRFIALAGIVAATLIVIASNSSTPLMAYVASLVAFSLWPMRKRMRTIRWGIVLTLISLHMVMKAPVWALIGRMDIVGGSGWHRFELVDNMIRRFGDWWLLGTKSNAEWGWETWDLANQYVAVGETTGLVPLIFFLAIIVYGFKYLGMARRASEGNKNQELFFWALGAALFANVMAFFGISYFDQTQVLWYTFLVMTSVATAPHRENIAHQENQAKSNWHSRHSPVPLLARATRPQVTSLSNECPSNWRLS